MTPSLTSRVLAPKTCFKDYRPFPNVAWRNALQEYVEVPALVHLLDLPPEGRILEVGCGRGIALPTLARLCRPAHLAGLDIDGALLAEAEERLNTRHIQAELVQADVRDIPLPDESLDIVIDFGTCYHIAQPERALSEISRVLSVGGIFMAETPVSQLLAHPTRGPFWRKLPYSAMSSLVPTRNALLWSTWVKR